MNLKHLALLACLSCLSATLVAPLSGCSTASPDIIRSGDAQHLSSVQDAVVINVRPVTVDGSQSGLGAAAGGLIGGIAGSGVGGHREGAIAGVLGAVVGGVVGNAAERLGTREQAVELMLQLANGERRSIVQATGGEVFAPGDAVMIVTSGGNARVMRAIRSQAR